jgi:hypothetical protein
MTPGSRLLGVYSSQRSDEHSSGNNVNETTESTATGRNRTRAVVCGAQKAAAFSEAARLYSDATEADNPAKVHNTIVM